jgi:hypothetical protein
LNILSYYKDKLFNYGHKYNQTNHIYDLKCATSPSLSTSNNNNGQADILSDMLAASAASANPLFAATNQPNNSNNYSNLLSYLSSMKGNQNLQQMPAGLNQLLLPLMLSQSPLAAALGALANTQAANGTVNAAQQPVGVPPVVSPSISPHLGVTSGASSLPEAPDSASQFNSNLDDENDQSDANNRRRRTRITEDQLKVLRQYFDINKSPSDEQIVDIAQRTKLQAKVIKHWFRNTLFKERQKDKDSPYNFNNPPVTQLNLEEYEKTGKILSATTMIKPAGEENAGFVKQEEAYNSDGGKNEDNSDSYRPNGSEDTKPTLNMVIIKFFFFYHLNAFRGNKLYHN